MSKKRIIIGGIAVLAIIGALTPDKKVESIEISIPNYQQKYDINTEIPVDISILPDGANTDSLEYIAVPDSITFSDSILNTGNSEGTYDIYIVSDDIKSNILSINVVDISSHKGGNKKTNEEYLQRSEDQKIAAESDASETEAPKVSEEQKLPEAPPENADLSDANIPDANDSVAPVQTPAPAEESATAETPSVPEESTSTPIGEMVWLSATGDKYHSINNCGRMNPNKARQVSLEYALNMNYQKCSKCW